MLVAMAFEGETGPMGGEDPQVKSNHMTLDSQCGQWTYTFNNDGSVDLKGFEEGYDDEGENYLGVIDVEDHYDSVLDLIRGKTDSGWFAYFATEYPDTVRIIETILEGKQ